MENSQLPKPEPTSNNPTAPPYPHPHPQYHTPIFYHHESHASAAAAAAVFDFDGFVNGVEQENHGRSLIYGGYESDFNYGGGGGGGGGFIDDDQIDAAAAAVEDQDQDQEDDYYIHGIKEEEYFDSLPSGFRFEPHDHELITDYLKKRIDNVKLPHNRIKLVNLYEQSPIDVTARYPELGENRWYFFTPRDRKYQNGSRPNRAAGNGYWKATGKDKSIKEHGGVHGAVIGFRKVLVFYDGRPKDGAKTNWTMHEYRVNQPSTRVRTSMTDMRLDDYVLCKLIRKPEKTCNKTRGGGGGGGTRGGRGGGGGGDQTSNDGGTSSNNSEENHELHPTINNAEAEHDQQFEVNSNRHLMINSPDQITPPPPPPAVAPMGYHYQQPPHQPQPQPQPQPVMMNNDVEGRTMAEVPAAPYSAPLKYNYEMEWDVYNLNQEIDTKMLLFPELENLWPLDSSPDPLL